MSLVPDEKVSLHRAQREEQIGLAKSARREGVGNLGKAPDRTGQSGPILVGFGPVRSGPATGVVRSGPVRFELGGCSPVRSDFPQPWPGPVRSGPVRFVFVHLGVHGACARVAWRCFVCCMMHGDRHTNARVDS